ncbi:response regulator [Chryseotalea sanaruensis]|uniref:Response regulator n=1 Tax=Chryseotalea sanaruensis TaxID=2482724 RepID=A0A401U4Z4_9BACT|nr:response regulator [Chryseotalea sanaruensis]GCC49856.1 response regulator [Chryseotalea sanaruensis]
MAKILVIDDELDICLMLTRHLQSLNFDSEYARTVHDASLQMDKHVYDLMFIDLNLLEGSGYDILNLVKKQNLKTKIIVISAHDSEGNRARDKGADMFIAKPFSTKIVNEALKFININSIPT